MFQTRHFFIYRIGYVFLFSFLLFFGRDVRAESLSLGISPASIQVDAVHPLYPVEKTLYIQHGNTSTPVIGEIALEGEGASFLSIPLTFLPIVFSVGEQMKEIPLLINAAGADIGKQYRAKAIFYIYGEAATDGSIPISYGITSAIVFSATDIITEVLSISGQPGEFTFDEEKPVGFSLRNKGNVSYHLDRVAFLVTRTDDGEVPQTSRHGVSLDKTLGPYTDTSLSFTRPFTLAPGRYQIQVAFFDGARLLETLIYDVEKIAPPSVSRPPFFSALFSASSPLFYIGGIAAVLVLFALGFFLLRRS